MRATSVNKVPDDSTSVAGKATTAACLLFGVVCPLVVALWYVHIFGVNIPVHDEWNFMPSIEAFYSGHDWPRSLIDHYGEHRVPVAKALILALAPFTKYNVKVEMYVSVFLMMLCVLVCWRLLKETDSVPWLLIPIGWLLLSTAQYHNLLVGWQLQIPLMNLFALLTVYFLSKKHPQPRHHLAAIGSAFAATFSFASGVMIWPAAIYLVWSRKRSPRQAAVWLALMVFALYLYAVGYTGFHRTPTDHTPDYLAAIRRSPGAVVGLFLAVVGNNFGEGRLIGGIVSGVTLVALLLMVLAAHLFVSRIRPDSPSGASTKALVASPWIALLMVSMMSAVAIAFGRSLAWREFATSSRYLTVTIFIPISILVIGQELVRRMPRGTEAKRITTAALIALLIFSGWQHLKTMQVGWIVGRATHDQNIRTIPCLLIYRTAPDDCLRNLYVADAGWVRKQATTLERWHLGPFAALPLNDQARESKTEEVSEANHEITGTLDRVTIERQADGTVLVTAEGWSIVGRRQLPATVALFLDEEWIGQTSVFYDRPDVSAFFGRQFPPVGWVISARLKALESGNHRAQVVLISRDGKVLGTLARKETSF